MTRTAGVEVEHNEAKLFDISSFPSQPLAAVEILRLVNNEMASSSQVAKVIELDPSLAARVIKLANSPYYGLSRSVSNPTQAVVLLGLTTVKAIAIGAATGLLSDDPQLGPIGLWTHAVTRGVAAAVLAEEIGGLRGDPFTAGLVCNIGVLLLARADPIRYKQVLNLASTGVDLHVCEERVFGTSHVNVGARALESWRFPSSLVRAISMHHFPIDTVADRLSRVLIAAGAFAHFVDSSFEEEPTEVPASVLSALKLPEDRTKHIAEKICSRIDLLAPTLNLEVDHTSKRVNFESDQAAMITQVRCSDTLPNAAIEFGLKSASVEFGKIESSNDSLASSLRQMLDVVTQVLPILSCALEIVGAGMNMTRITVGVSENPELKEQLIALDNGFVAILKLGVDPGRFAQQISSHSTSTQVVEQIAQLLTQPVQRLVNYEISRRKTAVEDVRRIAREMTAINVVSKTSQLGRGLVSLPGVCGATIKLFDHLAAISTSHESGTTSTDRETFTCEFDKVNVCFEVSLVLPLLERPELASVLNEAIHDCAEALAASRSTLTQVDRAAPERAIYPITALLSSLEYSVTTQPDVRLQLRQFGNASEALANTSEFTRMFVNSNGIAYLLCTPPTNGAGQIVFEYPNDALSASELYHLYATHETQLLGETV